MNLDLEDRLMREGIRHGRLSKAEKVRLLTRWIRAFPELVSSARHGETSVRVQRDRDAEARYAELPCCDYFILPDDASDMPSYECWSATPPDLAELVSDTFTRCDELVVVERAFAWSAVFVNHGVSLPGRHFCHRSGEADP